MIAGIVGLGLIGGSLAKAYKAGGAQVLAVDRDETVLSFAGLSGIVDDKLTKENISSCDVILIAVYPKAAVAFMEEMAPHIGEGPVVIDCCGTKRIVCEACFPLAEACGVTFVGGHPMAGTHKSGFKNADGDLFRGAPMVLVPPAFDNIHLLTRVKELLAPVGFGSISVTTAAAHDKMIAFSLSNSMISVRTDMF